MTSWDNFSRLGGKWLPLVVCSLALGWLVGQLVRAPQRRGCGCRLWTGLFAHERCRTSQFALLEWPALGGAVSLGSASPQDAKASERQGQHRAKQEPGRGVSWRLCLRGHGFQEERQEGGKGGQRTVRRLLQPSWRRGGLGKHEGSGGGGSGCILDTDG